MLDCTASIVWTRLTAAAYSLLAPNPCLAQLEAERQVLLDRMRQEQRELRRKRDELDRILEDNARKVRLALRG